MFRVVRKSSIALGALALACVALGACASPNVNGADQAILVEQRFPITVEPQMVVLAVRVDPDMQRLNASDAQRVQAFAERWKARGQGAMTVSAPQGSPNQRAAETTMTETVKMLTKLGVPMRSIERTGYPAATHPGEPPVTLSFVATAAVATDCSQLGWTDNLAFTPRNTPWNNFGCATQSNLAAMIANPNDLVEPQPMGDVDIARRAKVFEEYRRGNATQTKRQDSESGNVSKAASGGGQ